MRKKNFYLLILLQEYRNISDLILKKNDKVYKFVNLCLITFIGKISFCDVLHIYEYFFFIFD